MNDAQLHLLLNHLPSIGQVVGFATFLIGWTLKKNTVRQTGAWIILCAALFVFPANLSGEGAEEMIENMQGVSESLMHEHEEAAESALIFTLISGAAALALIAANRWKKSLNTILSVFVLLACLTSLYFLIDASHKGGFIRHPELNTSTVQNSNSTNEDNHDDED